MATALNGNTSKVALGILVGTMALLIFILGSFRSEVAAVSERSRENEKDIAVTQTDMETVKQDIQEIKVDVRSIAEAVGARRGER